MAFSLASQDTLKYNEWRLAVRFISRLKKDISDMSVMIIGAAMLMPFLMFGFNSLLADHLLKLEAF